jgi:hypothetical protein
VDYDPVEERMYWTETGLSNVIRSAYVTGRNVTTIRNLGLGAE